MGRGVGTAARGMGTATVSGRGEVQRNYIAEAFRTLSDEDIAAGLLSPGKDFKCLYNAETNPDACTDCKLVCKTRCMLLGMAASGDYSLICPDCPCKGLFKELYVNDDPAYRGAAPVTVEIDKKAKNYLPDPDGLFFSSGARSSQARQPFKRPTSDGGLNASAKTSAIKVRKDEAKSAARRIQNVKPPIPIVSAARRATPRNGSSATIVLDSYSIWKLVLEKLGGRGTLQQVYAEVLRDEQLSQWAKERTNWESTLRSFVNRENDGKSNPRIPRIDGPDGKSIFVLPGYKKPETASHSSGKLTGPQGKVSDICWEDQVIWAMRELGGLEKDVRLQDIYSIIQTQRPEVIEGRPTWRDCIRGSLNYFNKGTRKPRNSHWAKKVGFGLYRLVATAQS